MKTLLYDTQKEQIISEKFTDGYFIDGQKPVMPEHIVELEIIHPERPDLKDDEYLEGTVEIDLKKNQYIHGFEIRKKSKEQLDKENEIKEKQDERNLILNEIRSTDPPETLPGLADRMKKLETLILQLL